MAHQSLNIIRDTEEQAALLCRVAQERADEMLERVHAEGEALCADVERATEEELAATLALVRQKALAVKEKKREAAIAEAQALSDAARNKMAEAINLIVWEIIERCQ